MKIWKVDTQNYQEAETNNSSLGNDHNIIVADAESIPNQVEENINNFTGKKFIFSKAKKQVKSIKERPGVGNLSSVSLLPSFALW